MMFLFFVFLFECMCVCPPFRSSFKQVPCSWLCFPLGPLVDTRSLIPAPCSLLRAEQKAHVRRNERSRCRPAVVCAGFAGSCRSLVWVPVVVSMLACPTDRWLARCCPVITLHWQTVVVLTPSCFLFNQQCWDAPPLLVVQVGTCVLSTFETLGTGRM